MAKVYTAMLFIPVVGFFVPDEAVEQHSSFLLVAALLTVAYLSYWLHPQNTFLNYLRKCLGCLATGTLILLLSAQVGHILRVVYAVDFGEEIGFAVKMVLMLSNMEGNLDLCTSKHQHKHALPEQSSQV